MFGLFIQGEVLVYFYGVMSTSIAIPEISDKSDFIVALTDRTGYNPKKACLLA